MRSKEAKLPENRNFSEDSRQSESKDAVLKLALFTCLDEFIKIVRRETSK